MRLTAFFTAIAACALLSACGSSTSPGAIDNSGGITNLQSTDVKIGTGTEATNGRMVTVHYTLWLYSTTTTDHRGTRIQSSHDNTGQPFMFTLGVGQVIPGWDQGVAGMRVGGQRTLIIPPRLAYGSSGRDTIPPNSTLVFDIELLDVR